MRAEGEKRCLEAEEPEDEIECRAKKANNAQAGPAKCYECDIVRRP